MAANEIIGIVSALVLSGYCFFIGYCLRWWPRVLPGYTAPWGGATRVSVVVVAKDEADNMPGLMASLEKQTYPGYLIEVILVDDNSADETVPVARQQALAAGLAIKIIQLEVPDGWRGSRKKPAIQQAAAMASGNIVLLTDADCRPRKGWVSGHARIYERYPDTKLVFGAFFFPEKGPVPGLLNLEAASLTAVSAVTASRGWPTMCSGANLSYRRELVARLRPFDDNMAVVSGDDEFMLRAVHRSYPAEIRYAGWPETIVETAPPGSLGEFYNQRRRWAGKWKAAGRSGVWWLALLIFFGNLAFLMALASISLGEGFFLLIPMGAKWLLELALVFKVVRHFGLQRALRYFVPMEIIYPFYATFFGIASNFGKYHWKGRVYR